MRFQSVCAIAAVAGLAVAANAQPQGTVTFSFVLGGDAGDGVIDLGAGESTASIQLWADLDPSVNGQDVLGWGGSIFDLRGGGISGAGTIVAADPEGDGSPGVNEKLDDLSATYTLDASNSFILIETFQLPVAFNGNFEASDPVLIMEFDWVSDGVTLGNVSYDTANRVNMDIYFSALGGTLPWSAIESQTGFSVVPAPASLALLGLAGFAATRRRR